MPNRILTATELQKLLEPLLVETRAQLFEKSAGDIDLYWALRRKLAKELTYDERGKPTARRQLKRTKYAEQSGQCANCGGPLPARGAVLDRLQAMQGYTKANTRLLCASCDFQIQQQRGFR
jgi:ribosomal protein L44E